MAVTVTVEEYADRVDLTFAGLNNGSPYYVYVAPWNNALKKDRYKSFFGTPSGEYSLSIYSCLPGHTYYYWLYSNAISVLEGPIRLKQYKLFGSRTGGGTRKKTLDYDVECPLCGFT